MDNTDDILKRPIRNYQTPSEHGFVLDMATITARNETANLERVKRVKTPRIVPNLRQALQTAKDSVVKALGG